MKKLSIIAIILSAIAIILSLYVLGLRDNLGVGMVQPSSWYGATLATSSVTSVATVTPILSLDAARTNAKVCYLSGTDTVWLYPLATATTTGVVVNKGIPIYPTSTQIQTCEEFPGFKGNLMAISASTSTVTITSYK